MFFSSSHVWMWELVHKEDWVPQNWCFQTVVLEKSLESPLDCKKTKSVNPKGNQPWIFTGRTDADAEILILWPPDVKNRLIGKDPDAGKDWRQEEKGTTEDEMVGWHPRLNGQEFEQALGVGDRQGSLMCYSPWGRKESDTTERLNWTLETVWQCLTKLNIHPPCVHACSVMSSFVILWIVAQQAPLSMGLFRQECWSWLPFPFPGDLPNPGTEPTSPASVGRFFTTEPPGKSIEDLPDVGLEPWPWLRLNPLLSRLDTEAQIYYSFRNLS